MKPTLCCQKLASTHRHVHRALRQLFAEAALIELRHLRALQLIALVQKRHPERKADIVENLGVLGPGDHRARAHHCRQIAIHEGVAREICHPHHVRHDALLGLLVEALDLRQHNLGLGIV